MFSDAPWDSPIETGKRVMICITSNEIEKSNRIFDALQQDGHVNMPLQEESFCPGFGDVTDKFGVTFQVYTEM
jgi:PhnB protein